MTDPLISRLADERDALLDRVNAIDHAIEALTGTRPVDTPAVTVRTAGAGADKVEMVRSIIQKHGEIRQAEIAQMFDPPLNSGTVSQATTWLKAQGEIEELPKRDRSKVWRAIG